MATHSIHQCAAKEGVCENPTGQSSGQMKKINYSGCLADIRNHDSSPRDHFQIGHC